MSVVIHSSPFLRCRSDHSTVCALAMIVADFARPPAMWPRCGRPIRDKYPDPLDSLIRNRWGKYWVGRRCGAYGPHGQAATSGPGAGGGSQAESSRSVSTGTNAAGELGEEGTDPERTRTSCRLTTVSPRRQLFAVWDGSPRPRAINGEHTVATLCRCSTWPLSTSEHQNGLMCSRAISAEIFTSPSRRLQCWMESTRSTTRALIA